MPSPSSIPTPPSDASLNTLLKVLIDALTPSAAKAQLQQRVAVRVGIAAGLIRSKNDAEALKELQAALPNASVIGAATALKIVISALEQRL